MDGESEPPDRQDGVLKPGDPGFDDDLREQLRGQTADYYFLVSSIVPSLPDTCIGYNAGRPGNDDGSKHTIYMSSELENPDMGI
ncbi:MAG: hypothetical protein ACP5D2_01375 [Candidatus Nanoarchaeia archaeon]